MTEVTIAGHIHHIEEYCTPTFVSPEFQVEVFARMLAGYSEAVWENLSSGRKRTYKHAAAGLLAEWEQFQKLEEEWRKKT